MIALVVLFTMTASGFSAEIPVVEILTAAQPDKEIAAGEFVQVYGDNHANHIEIASGARVRMLHMLGGNVITIKADARKFHVSRSGAMVTFKGDDGTRVSLPATSEEQTIRFFSRERKLQIRNNQIFLSSQKILLEERIITPEPGEEWVEPVTGMKFVWVPKGSFLMGSAPDDEDAHSKEKPQHRVTLTRGFWMGKYEVTQAQWKQIMGSNPSYYQIGVAEPDQLPAGENTDNMPVDSVSWNDTQEFIAKFNEATGQSSALPTEAQWERAARGGVENQKYSGSNNVDDVAWYDGEQHEVGKKESNAWNLHDMSGNVEEWCQDWFDSDYYTKSPDQDPKGPAAPPEDYQERVTRGGSRTSSAPGALRSAVRYSHSPEEDDSWDYVGFRILIQP